MVCLAFNHISERILWFTAAWCGGDSRVLALLDRASLRLQSSSSAEVKSSAERQAAAV